ncbi:MAG: hypothetical protein F6J95_022685 [Leptolyngbya sp. SIO1E4]|nr:hypothetical protein [Leptolyngbya sp. SIO1E4]
MFSSERCFNECRSRSQQILGTYNLETDKLTILYQGWVNDPSERCLKGVPVDTVDHTVLLNHEEDYCLLDLDSGKTELLPLFEEVNSAEACTRPHIELLDPQGLMLLECMVPDEEKISLNSVEMDLWVRHSDGEIALLGRNHTPFVVDEKVYFWDQRSRQSKVYNLRRRVFEARVDDGATRPEVDFHNHPPGLGDDYEDGQYWLTIEEIRERESLRRRLPITAESLFQRGSRIRDEGGE